MQFDLYSAIYAILIAFLANIILSPIIIPFLTKLKFGQNVRDDGPKSHLIKAGTPTMGGIIILISLVISSLFFLKGNYDAIAVLFVTIGYGIVGFIDDYIKVVKKRSLGLKAYQKIIGQLIITIIFLIYIYKFSNIGTDIYIPFTNGKTIELGILFIP
ncbi:MAG: phospho-N-acetylmuramoyl-pentapeptide-transferase, partial [Eubacteriales bacterium]|nr:phospho-N-acetylmuramoyl-pentapeptide-transferase [Eubacteriales bacterium]